MRRNFVATILLLAAWAGATASCGPQGTPDAGDVVGDAFGSTARIGPEGGVLRFEGVTLVVPAGALAAVQTLSIARAPQQAAPAGLVAYAPIYRFEPAGTQFAVPARVSMRFTGDRGRAEIYWTAAGGAFEPLASSSVAGDEASAPVTHFSDGFVGAPELPPVDGGGMDVEAPPDVPKMPDVPVMPDVPMFDVPVTPDAPTLDVPSEPDATSPDGMVPSDTPAPMDGPAMDGPATDGASGDTGVDGAPADASRPPGCPMPQTVDPVTGGGWSFTVFPDFGPPPPALSCVSPIAMSGTSVAFAVVRLTTTMRMTVRWPHSTHTPGYFGYTGDCATGPTACTSRTTFGYPIVVDLAPGVYRLEYSVWSMPPSVTFAPPSAPPPPTNLSCATASPIPSGVDSATDSSPRYYYFDVLSPTPSGFALELGRPNVAYDAAFELRDACPGGTLRAGPVHDMASTGGTVMTVPSSLPAGRYWVIVTPVASWQWQVVTCPSGAPTCPF